MGDFVEFSLLFYLVSSSVSMENQPIIFVDFDVNISVNVEMQKQNNKIYRTISNGAVWLQMTLPS